MSLLRSNRWVKASFYRQHQFTASSFYTTLVSQAAIHRLCDVLDGAKDKSVSQNATTVTSSSSSSYSFNTLAKRLSYDYEFLPTLEMKQNSNQKRGHILELLVAEFGTSHESIVEAAKNYTSHASDKDLPFQRSQLLKRLQDACTPQYERLFHIILADDAQKGIQFLVQLRQDLLNFIKIKSIDGNEILVANLKLMDVSLRSLLAFWFSSETLEIRRITYQSSSAAIIETIATKEAVHPVRSLDDLRTRLGPDKRVFCAFHPLWPEEPLVFVHVALGHSIPSALNQVLNSQTKADLFTVATMYSISATQSGLSGIDLGHSLLQKAMTLLRQEIPSLSTFVTLSPIPGFRTWMKEKLLTLQRGGKFLDTSFLSEQDFMLLCTSLKCSTTQDAVECLSRSLEDPWKLMESQAAEDLRPLLLKLVTRYLVVEKHRRKPLDGVARFHIQNGAELIRLNYKADLTRKGIHNSLGIMVNYQYPLERVEQNRLRHADEFSMPVHEDVLQYMQVS
jgi:malonyl-CoA decarboxylase